MIGICLQWPVAMQADTNHPAAANNGRMLLMVGRIGNGWEGFT